jgi:hypothetical protein
VGNGWRRYFVSGTAGSETSIDALFRFTSAATGSTIGYTGDGIQSFQLWGAQLEAGASPTSYIPTTTAQVTRSADAASMTGANFSSWYRQDEGSIYSEFAGGNTAVQIGENSNFNSRVAIYGQAANFLVSNSSGTNQAVLLSFSSSSSNLAKIAGTYSANNFAACVNGGAVSTDVDGTVPNPSLMAIGSRNPASANSFLNGTIKKIAYYPKRLANAELQALTQN